MENSVSAGNNPTTWHLYWRAATGRDLVATPKLAEKITERLMGAHRRPGRRLLYYLLTPSEIHVLSVIPAGERPTKVVREAATVVARWVRELQGVRGPVFAEPYRAHEIRTEAELKEELRMIAWRPVVTGLSRAPIQYAHSSLRTTLGYRRAHGFDSRPLLGVFGATVLEARKAMRSLIRRRPSQAEMREWELNHGIAVAVGSKGASFGLAREVGGSAAALVAAAPGQNIDGALQLLERWVAYRLELPVSENLATMPGAAGARARALVAGLAVQVRLCPAASVARHFGRARATLSEQMTASRLRDADRQLMATPMAFVLDELNKLSKRASL